MSGNDTFLLKLYVLLSPLVLLLTLYVTVRAAGWLERREEQRHAAE
jgi:hypothetical protein